VLTGVIAGLLARGLAPADAATAAAYVHGLAGHLAAKERGEGCTAGDVLDHLPWAIREVLQG
jgi:NAD(P)H-hydrate epimerase